MKLVLFDFDGVIVDSFELSYTSMKEVNPEAPDRDVYRGYFDGNIYEAKDISVPKKANFDETSPFFKHYIPKLMATDPFPGMKEVLSAIEHQAHASIVSSTLSNPIDSYLASHDMRSLFHEIYGADVELNKTRKIRSAMEKHKVEEHDVLFVTDTLGDIREARKAGVESVAVTWGFHPEERLLQGEPRAVVHSPEHLLTEIETFLF